MLFLPHFHGERGFPSWLKDRTSKAVFELNITSKKEKLSHKSTKIYRNPIILAQEWKQLLENGEHTSQADLASSLGVTRARVTQVLRLLRLDNHILKAISALGDPLPLPIVTERILRTIVSLSHEKQREVVDTILTRHD